MKIILPLLACLVAGCASTGGYETDGNAYRIENGLLRVRPSGYEPLPIPIPQTNILPESPNDTTAGKPEEYPPVSAPIKKSTQPIRNRMK